MLASWNKIVLSGIYHPRLSKTSFRQIYFVVVVVVLVYCRLGSISAFEGDRIGYVTTYGWLNS